MVKRFYMDNHQIRMIRSVLLAKGTYFILGQNSIYVPKRREKYIDQSTVTEWPDLQGEIILMTPGEIARTELKREWPDLKRIGWQKPQYPLLDYRWPMHYGGPYKGGLIYTDLIGAYHQIYSRLWLNTAFPLGYGSLDLLPVAKKLDKHKRARNSLIGITRSTQVTGIKGGKRITLKSHNPWLSPPLWAVVQEVLNEIAFIALQSGAIYVATDGYIHPNKSNHKDFHRMLDLRGVIYRTHEGDGEIRGWGNYITPQRQTSLHKNNYPTNQKTFSSISIFNKSDYTQVLDWWSYKVPQFRERTMKSE